MSDPNLPPPPPPALSTELPPLPWEDSSFGLLGGFIATVQLFVGRPKEAFNRLSDEGIGRPYFYAVITGWISVIAGFAYVFLLQAPFFIAAIPELQDELAGAALGMGMMVAIVVGIILLSPIAVAIGLFIGTCILHLMLLIIGEGRAGFATTFRVLAYSQTAQLASVIPFCGGVINLIWSIVLQIIGLAEAHRCSYGKAALAVFLPLLLCCACVALIFGLGFGTAIIGALSEQG